MSAQIRSVIRGCGSYLPERVVTNAELSARLDTSDDWIVERSGIRVRHIAAEDEMTSDLATAAARKALAAADLPAESLSFIIVATATPDHTFPATAAKVQAKLGARGAAAFDIQAVCSGFIYALSVADGLLKGRGAGHALVIGAETFSRILDWEDRTTAVLFGDGAGAVVLSAEQARPGANAADRGILSTHLYSDGRHHDLLYVDGGPSSTRTTGHLRMAGREVFRHAVVNLAEAAEAALTANGVAAADLDWLVPHQANRRIIMGTLAKLGLSESRAIVTIDRHANTSAASIPLALCEAVEDGRIRPGHLVLLEAMGGGFTWGSALVRM